MTDPRPTTDSVGSAQRAGSAPALVVGAVMLALVVTVLAVSVFFSLPSNVLSARDGGGLRVIMARTLPQSWAFFTKPPNDPEIAPYQVRVYETLQYASLLPNSRRSNFYGLTRKQRAQGPEVANLFNQIPALTTCTAGQADCLEEIALTGRPVTLHNTSKVPTLCGRLLLVETVPVPWAFRHDYGGWRMEKRAALVEVTCS